MEDEWPDWHGEGCCVPELDPVAWRFKLIPTHQIRTWARENHYANFAKEHEDAFDKYGRTDWLLKLADQTAPRCWCGYFDQMFDRICNLCGSLYDVGRLVVDHDHATGMVRGYLCRSCNASEPHHGGLFSKWRKYPTAVIYGFPPMKYEGFGMFRCPDNPGYDQTFLDETGTWRIPYNR